MEFTEPPGEPPPFATERGAELELAATPTATDADGSRLAEEAQGMLATAAT
jgi:hypothetical protein